MSTSEHPLVAPERANFKSLLVANPNHFGTQMGSGFPVVAEISADTTYEEVECVSYNPDLNLVEATISIKLPYGYGGGLCQPGSLEFVAFYVDYGTGWENAGLSTVHVHDVPEALDCFDAPIFPLSYTATAQFQPARQRCSTPVLPTVRAVLSWSVMPTGPDFVPVWGNVAECQVQVKPRPFLVVDLVADIAAELGQTIKLPPALSLAEQVPLPGPPPEALTLAELAQLYSSDEQARSRGAHPSAVPAHRFGFSQLDLAANSAKLDAESLKADAAAWDAAGLDWPAAAAALNEVDANVTFEQLECVGLDTNLDRLVASFQVKRPTGYNGGLCQAGSTEYVAFWASGWDDSCGWSYLGTASVAVHDISPMPPDGLCYAAVLPVNLTHQRKLCSEPKELRVRAVLSWQVPPSSTDPDALPTWGNRLDTHVQVAPGAVVPPGTVAPLIGLLGGIPVSEVDPVSGLTTPTAAFALLGGSVPADPGAMGRPCPFALAVSVQGPSFPGYQYRVQVKRSTDPSWSTVNNSFSVVDETGTVFTKQVATGDYFNYLPDTANVDNVLAVWETSGNDLWQVKLDILGVAGSDVHTLQLHNSGLDASIGIDILAGDCGKFPTGTVLAGNFVARDLDTVSALDYLDSYSLWTSPFPSVQPFSPTGGLVSTPASPGTSWSLDTTGMKPCGYTLNVTAAGRAIQNSSPSYPGSTASTGFCLMAP